MNSPLLRTFNSLKAVIKQLAALLVMIVMLLNLMPLVATAANTPETNSPIGAEDATEEISDQDYRTGKEERQEWQSKASAVRQDEENKPTSLGEKLNIDELAKGYHPGREAEKRSVPTP